MPLAIENQYSTSIRNKFSQLQWAMTHGSTFAEKRPKVFKSKQEKCFPRMNWIRIRISISRRAGKCWRICQRQTKTEFHSLCNKAIYGDTDYFTQGHSILNHIEGSGQTLIHRTFF